MEVIAVVSLAPLMFDLNLWRGHRQHFSFNLKGERIGRGQRIQANAMGRWRMPFFSSWRDLAVPHERDAPRSSTGRLQFNVDCFLC